MFDTQVINVAIGLVFCFAATALAASTITEALASIIRLPANTLVTGVQKMLDDPEFKGLALAIYKHALVANNSGLVQAGWVNWLRRSRQESLAASTRYMVRTEPKCKLNRFLRESAAGDPGD